MYRYTGDIVISRIVVSGFHCSILTGLEETGNPVFELKIGIVPGPTRWLRRACL